MNDDKLNAVLTASGISSKVMVEFRIDPDDQRVIVNLGPVMPSLGLTADSAIKLGHALIEMGECLEQLKTTDERFN